MCASRAGDSDRDKMAMQAEAALHLNTKVWTGGKGLVSCDSALSSVCVFNVSYPCYSYDIRLSIESLQVSVAGYLRTR